MQSFIHCCLWWYAGGVGSTHLSNFLTGAGLRCNLLTDQDAARHAARWGVDQSNCMLTGTDHAFFDCTNHRKQAHAWLCGCCCL
jgi:hypothetical protein